MKHIALVPRGTGSGHNMRLYAIARELNGPRIKSVQVK